MFRWSHQKTPRGSGTNSVANEVADSEQKLARWMTPFAAALEHTGRRRWAPVYTQGAARDRGLGPIFLV